MNWDEAAHPSVQYEPRPCASERLLAREEARAPIKNLSPTRRAALIACITGDGTLHKCCGVWKSPCAGICDTPIFGVTVADLSREGMMTVTVSGKKAVARLTTRGSWFARTAATEKSEEEREHGRSQLEHVPQKACPRA
jgi:hypothetical protein